MKLFARRTPLSWGMLVFGLLPAALAICAVATGDVVVPGRRSSPTRHVLQSADPRGYAFMLRVFVLFALSGLTLAFVRVVPIEDGWRRFKERSNATIHAKGYDSKPAPMWAYGFLVAFIGLIIWIGWKFMYSE
jgi:hypothetical protein